MADRKPGQLSHSLLRRSSGPVWRSASRRSSKRWKMRARHSTPSSSANLRGERGAEEQGQGAVTEMVGCRAAVQCHHREAGSRAGTAWQRAAEQGRLHERMLQPTASPRICGAPGQRGSTLQGGGWPPRLAGSVRAWRQREAGGRSRLRSGGVSSTWTSRRLPVPAHTYLNSSGASQ